MTISIPSEQDVTLQISVTQARELYSLLNSSLSPRECLQRSSALFTEQTKTNKLLTRLDNADIPASFRDNYSDYRRYIKGNILGTMNSVRALGLRVSYVHAIESNTAQYLNMLREGEKDVAVIRSAAQGAVNARAAAEERFSAHSGRRAAEMRQRGWAVLTDPVKKVLLLDVGTPTLDSMVLNVTGGTALEALTDDRKLEVLTRVAQKSAKIGTVSELWATAKSMAAPAQMAIDLLLTIEDAKYARDPLRTITAKTVRMGTAVVVGTVVDAVGVSLMAMFSVTTAGVGCLVFIAGTYLLNSFINDWINESIMSFYDELNPRISKVMRDLSWEPEKITFALEESLPLSPMEAEIKVKLI